MTSNVRVTENNRSKGCGKYLSRRNWSFITGSCLIVLKETKKKKLPLE